MNGIDFLADTNAVLYYLSGNSCMKPFITCRFAFSIISEMELLSYSKITDDEEKKIGGFLNGSLPILITNEIKNMTIQLRRKYNIKLPLRDLIAKSKLLLHGDQTELQRFYRF